jgi:hypothetical protein
MHIRAVTGLLATALVATQAASNGPLYTMSDQGQSCAAACGILGRTCLPFPVNISTDVFTNASGGRIVCNKTTEGGNWWAPGTASSRLCLRAAMWWWWWCCC